MQRRLNESTEKSQKVKKLLWSYRLCWIFRNGRFSWECPKKYPKGPKPDFQKRAYGLGVSDKIRKIKILQTGKMSILYCKNRIWSPSEDLQKQKNWRIHITGYQICKFNIWWKNAESYDLRYLPRRSVTAEVRSGSFRLRFLRKLLRFDRFGKIKWLKLVPGQVGVPDGIGG